MKLPRSRSETLIMIRMHHPEPLPIGRHRFSMDGAVTIRLLPTLMVRPRHLVNHSTDPTQTQLRYSPMD